MSQNSLFCHSKWMFLCFFCIALPFVHCGDSSTEPTPDTHPLVGNWKLNNSIISLKTGIIELFKDTLIAGKDSVLGECNLKADSTHSFLFKIDHDFIIDTITLPVDTTFSNSGTWYANDSLLVMKDQNSNELPLTYVINNGIMTTNNNINIDNFTLQMISTWMKQ